MTWIGQTKVAASNRFFLLSKFINENSEIPMEHPCDHQRQGWPDPPSLRADPISQGPLLAHEQPVDGLLPD